MSKQEQRQTRLGLPSVSNLCKTKFLSALAVTALLFASCSSDDDNTPEVNDGRVLFSSGVNAATPKVGGNVGSTWDQNDPVGIFMVKHGQALSAANILEGADNVEYKAKDTGMSTAFTAISSPIFYPVNGDKADFIAYHPYKSTLTDFKYPINVATQTNQSAIDLLYATADKSGAGYDKSQGTTAVDMKFSHQLTKVVIKVTKGAGVADLTGMTVKIKGMNTTADFDLVSPAISNEADVADITPYNVPSSTNYEAILLPVTFTGSHVVEFTVGGNTYSWTMSKNVGDANAQVTELKPAHIYTFNVTVKKNEVEAKGTIQGWTMGGAFNGTAD
ncbi:fimbrillin family protein [Prevotella sp. 10(H)]|uniref:fimbrillin family protein n=1 Tax=Prevotella sp. 10(H) TaxID=1158294 RepID=UPI000AA07491|nr:fimbrillin family protein [Prevotella sp. 10(H)]